MEEEKWSARVMSASVKAAHGSSAACGARQESVHGRSASFDERRKWRWKVGIGGGGDGPSI